MKRLIVVFAAAATLTACGNAAADGREVANLSTTGVDDATTDTSDSAADSTETTGVVDPTEGPLQFAECMREHGIDMPDPIVGDGGEVMVQIGGPAEGGGPGEGPDPEEMEAAHKECEQFLGKAGADFEPPSEEDQRKMQEQALEFSQCMRDHGIDMPDPQFSAGGGGFSVSIESAADGTSDGPKIDFDSDEFNEASEACGQEGGGLIVSSGSVGG